MIYKIIGTIVGGVLGFLLGVRLPYLLGTSAVEKSGDPSAAGGMFLLMVFTVPIGTVLGGVIGFIAIAKKKKNG